MFRFVQQQHLKKDPYKFAVQAKPVFISKVIKKRQAAALSPQTVFFSLPAAQSIYVLYEDACAPSINVPPKPNLQQDQQE